MNLQYTLFVILAPIATTIALIAFHYSRRYRATPGALWLSRLILLISGWLIFNTLELVAQSEVYTLFWAKVTYIFIVSVPLGWIAFAFQYTERLKWLERSRFALLCIIPSITIILVWTNDAHSLIWQSYQFTHIYKLTAITVSHGVWFWLQAAYSYTIVIAGSVFIAIEYFKSSRLYRQQTIWLLIGSMIPLVINLIYLFGLIPGLKKDYSPISFALAGIAATIGILRYRLFDLKPVAHRILIDSMGDGMMVLDEQNRIVDLNPAFQAIIDVPTRNVVGQHAGQWFSPWPDLVERFQDKTHAQAEINLDFNGEQKHYDYRISPLCHREQMIGRLIVLRDISDRKQAEEELRKNELRYRALFELTNDAVFILSLDLVHLAVNKQAADLLGYRIDELVGMHAKQIVAPEEFFETQERASIPLAGKTPKIYEQTFIRKDGSRVSVEISVALVHDQEGSPLHIQSIVRDITERKQTMESLLERAVSDPLTDCFNRRHFFTLAEKEFSRSVRYDHPISVIMLDLDHFKRINDLFGHAIGDQVLQSIVKTCQENIRDFDILGRYGGEEFVILLPETNIENARQAADRIRKEIEKSSIETDAGMISITASLGITSLTDEDDLTLDKLLDRADQALYKSKEGGRNKVTIWQDTLKSM